MNNLIFFFSSLKLNQKLQINIKDSVLKEESSESNESFTKVASMLREVIELTDYLFH